MSLIDSLGENLKIRKREWKYTVEAGLEGGGVGVTLFLFNFFKVYHFYI